MSDRVSRIFGGRRGAVLVLLGSIFALIGVGYVTQAHLTPNISQQLHFALKIAPHQVWGGVFIVVGVVTLINSRWPGGQLVGYGLLTSMSVLWSFMYWVGAVEGVEGSYRGALSWSAIAILVLIISGWEELPTPSIPRREDLDK